MKRLLDAVRREAAWTLSRPGRLRGIFNREKRRRFFRALFAPGWTRSDLWQRQPAGGSLVRRYDSYQEYMAHQQSKLPQADLQELRAHDAAYARLLEERLQAHGMIAPGMTALCLGARLGGEVVAFRQLGCFAVGIDLNPGSGNPYVLYGDFHALQFADSSSDIVFTNSLDHVLEIDRVLSEVRRVLKPGGLLITEAVRGTEEAGASGASGDYESFLWTRVDDLIRLLERHGFALLWRRTFNHPWPGEHLCLRGGGHPGPAEGGERAIGRSVGSGAA